MSEELSISQALDAYLEKAQMCALELADRAEKPFLCHNSNQFTHPLTGTIRSTCTLVYAGPHAGRLEKVVAKAAKDFLTNKSQVNGSKA